MINLLPPQEKKELLLERNKNIVIVLGNIVVISLVCLTLVLLSLKLYVKAESKYYNAALIDIEKKYRTPDSISLKKVMENYNKSLSSIDAFYKKGNHVADSIKAILEVQRPENLYFNTLDISRPKEDGKVNISLSGKSDTRENLQKFRDNLKESAKIKNVSFPPDNWIKSNDINFRATFEVVRN